MAKWQVYLLKCADGTLYCGITSNLARRLAQHNGLECGGAKYTRSRRPVTLQASCVCESRSTALKMEAAVKAMSRVDKLRHFQSMHSRDAGN